MKILIDARFYGLEHAGLGRYTMNLLYELSKIDAKNEYIILLRKNHYKEVTLPDNWQKVEFDTKHYSFKEQAELPQIIRKYKPDITHFLHSNIPIFFKDTFVVTIHDMTMYKQGIDATTLPLPLYLAKRIPFKLIFRKAVYESQRIITPSKAVKDEIVDYFKVPSEKITVTYEGVSMSAKMKDTKGVLTKYGVSPKKYFLYVGNLYPHKNMKRAIEAILLVNKQSGGKIDFCIVSGRGIFRERLIRDIKALGAEKYVKVLDFVSDEELEALYKNSIGFVFPSLSEGFGLPGLEALQSGTQLLASDIPVFKEIYREYAMYFNPKDVDSIKKTMIKALSLNIPKDSNMLLKNYSWEEMAKETLHVYEQCK